MASQHDVVRAGMHDQTASVMRPASVLPPAERPRFLSEADCHAIAQRLARAAQGGGGGDTSVSIVSRWAGNVRWARNLVSQSGEDRDNHVVVLRDLRGAEGRVTINDVTDEALVAAARRAERLARMNDENLNYEVLSRPDSPFRYRDEPFTAPQLFFDTTYQLDAGRRADAARHLAHSAADAGMLSAGYIEVSASSMAYITSWGYARYFQYTWAQYSVTVRDPTGVGSGWAGVDWPDWSKIDGAQLSAIALDKCLKSRNPVAVEPGRYTTILEPQAVCDFIGQMIYNSGALDRKFNEIEETASFHLSGMQEPPGMKTYPIGFSRLDEKIIDERITISADPLDPELGFPPFAKSSWGDIHTEYYHPVTWIEHGVLKNEFYNRQYGSDLLGRNTGLPNAGAFRMSGGPTSIAEMIATTKRGLLVTRFDRVSEPYGAALLCRGYTRDGLWLIEDGKISKAVKNFMFVESVLFALNNVEQLGPPQRTFHPGPDLKVFAFLGNPQPVIVPPLKIKDFSFTALSEAI